MQITDIENHNEGSFLMHKFQQAEENSDKTTEEFNDKVKILELSNFIDTWEQELLFSENGFFSIKGKEVQNKTQEFISELKELINAKINEIHFEKETSKNLAKKIRDNKINSLLLKMQIYEQQELNNHRLRVCDEALNAAVTRAVLYKNNDDVIVSSYKNGLAILNLMAEREEWNSKIYKQKEESFKSKFYLSLIEAYIKDKDVKACKYFFKYKKDIIVDNFEEIEESIENFKTEIISYNWVKELLSYNLSDKEQQQELNKIEDKKIKTRASEYLKEFSTVKKKDEEQKQKDKNENNWQEILRVIDEDINQAALYVDFTLKKKHTDAVYKYIKQIKSKGYIETDIKCFLNLFSKFLDNINEFKSEDLSDYRANLSREDFELFKNLTDLKISEYNLLAADYKYVLSAIKSKDKLNDKGKYDLLKEILFAFDEYKNEKNKKPDIIERRKILDVCISGFTEIN